MSKLKNCPFCWEEAELYVKCDMFWARCLNEDCGAKRILKFDKTEEAIEDWNCRKDRWIPVSERLPEEYTMVLVYDGNNIHRAELMKGQWYGIPYSAGFLSEQVTYWMPFPAPPEGAE